MGKRSGWSRERFFDVCLAAATLYCESGLMILTCAQSPIADGFWLLFPQISFRDTFSQRYPCSHGCAGLCRTTVRLPIVCLWSRLLKIFRGCLTNAVVSRWHCVSLSRKQVLTCP